MNRSSSCRAQAAAKDTLCTKPSGSLRCSEHVPADDEVRSQLGDVAAGDEEGLPELQRAAAVGAAPCGSKPT